MVVTASSNPENLEPSLIFRIETKSQNRNSVFRRTKPKTEFSIPLMCEWNSNGDHSNLVLNWNWTFFIKVENWQTHKKYISECISKCSLYTWKEKLSLPEMGPHSAPTWAGPYFGRAHSRLGLYSTLWLRASLVPINFKK